jgi:hypothetical protein
MRDYRLYELPDSIFEELIGMVCRQELGTGAVIFSPGRDGGRDGRFSGVAARYPSQASPWSGNFIVQAKHTSSPVASCSDPEFETNKTSVIAQEIPRIIELRAAGELGNYLLFTNRKMSGGAHARISKRITSECGVTNFGFIGGEKLGQLVTLHFRDLVKVVPQLASALGPLRVFPQDIGQVIDAIAAHGIVKKATDTQDDPVFIDLDEKNELNKLGERYFQHLQTESGPYFEQIRGFLKDPRNEALAAKYDSIVADFNHRVIIRRDAYDRFDEVFEAIYDNLVEQEPTFREKSRLVLTLLHYMYWECDLGEKVRASAKKTS